jgi:8-oxo-dGTP pyrophosphatase MutT (NUDIX family)
MPEVPAQIPGGTIEPDGETPEEAVRREVSEETGLDQFALIRKLGVSRWFWAERQIWIQRHVFLLEAPASTADRWTHVVTGSGEDNQLRFACLWIKPTKEFRLGGGLDLFLTGGYLPELFAE